MSYPLPDFFSPAVREWFTRCIGQPTPIQAEGWPAIASGAHTLISAPTGTGKTLTAFLGCIDALYQAHCKGEMPQGVQVVYLSPLKALAADIRENLRRPLEGLGFSALRTGIRTGDTDPKERQRMLRNPPHILITTPESLYLLLTSKAGQTMLSTAKTVIVDEFHALMGTKRGSHLALSLTRLDDICGRKLQRIGLSATLRPLETAARMLVPVGDTARILAPDTAKEREIRVEGLLEDMRAVGSRTIWPDIARRVYEHCCRVRTVIAFVESRAQAEKLAFEVNALAGEGYALTHHGCVSREQRYQAEQALRSGELHLLCATSSMELGIDVGEVDQVIQIGLPATVSGMLQRLGRAGHAPGRVSVMRIFPKTAADGLACTLLTDCALEGLLEPLRPPMNCLDILAQHLVSMAATRSWQVEEALALVNLCPAFAGITQTDVEGVLAMLAGDWEHRRDKPVKPRLDYDRIHGMFTGDAYSRMLATAGGGTIPDRGWFPVVLADGTRLGELDEEYVFEARIGDTFLLGAFAWRIGEISRDRVVVTPAPVQGALPPFWHGEAQGRAYPVALAMAARMRQLEEASRMEPVLRKLHADGWTAWNAARYLAEQKGATGCLPDDRTVIVEHFQDEAGDHQLMVHSLFGRQVNYPLSLLLQHTARRITGQDIHGYEDDNGILLYLLGTQSLPEGLLFQVDRDKARNLLQAMLPASTLFSLVFRCNASRALMLGVRQGQRVPLWVQRLRGAEALTHAAGDTSHPLVRESLRECMEDWMDIPALLEVLEGIQGGRIRVRELHHATPSPMALPMRRQMEMQETYNYYPVPQAARNAVEQQLAALETLPPQEALLEEALGSAATPETPAQWHASLMTQGDRTAEETPVALAVLQTLAEDGRALYIEPGLWIAAEEEALYTHALAGEDREALYTLVRRCLRYRGGQDADSLMERYRIPSALCQEALEILEKDGTAVLWHGLYYHGQVFAKAQRMTVQLRRQEAETLPMERYAAMMARQVRPAGSPAQQLRQAVDALADLPYPPALWEGMLLPARVARYRPALLDALLAQGEVYWQLQGGEKPALQFHRAQDADWDALPEAGECTQGEDALYQALLRRGASFAAALAPLLPGEDLPECLMSLAARGLIRADSFVPVRQWGAGTAQPKKRAAARAQLRQAGRWEVLHPLLPLSREVRLERALDRAKILCRETAGDIPWKEALEILRIWEYTGKVRRGYFIQGLSGAQFIRSDQYDGVRAALAQPGQEVLWLHANDPAQLWGRVLPHREGAAFALLPTHAVALQGGRAVAVLEHGGEHLRFFQADAGQEAIGALAQDFLQGRVYAARSRLTLKRVPEGAESFLQEAGFSRQMDDWVLWRRSL